LRAALFLFSAALSAQSDELASKSHQAKELMGAGRFTDAVPIYEQLCRALPRNTGLRLNLGLALQMSGMNQKAIPQFEQVLKAEPNNEPALLSLGASLLEIGDGAKSVPPLMKLVNLHPDNVNARGLLAQALLASSRLKEASVQYRKLTSLTPDSPKAWFGSGQVYELLSKHAFEELNRTAEGSAEWLALVGESRIGQRQYRSAFFFYQQALKKQPNLSGAHAALATIYRATEHAEWAEVEELRETALAGPNCIHDKRECDLAAGRLLDAASSHSAYVRSRAYNYLAVQAFSTLGKLPESIESHALKAEIFESHGQYLEAVSEWRSALALAPQDSPLDKELAKALYLAHDFEHALPAIERLSKRDVSAADFQFFAGDCLFHLERLEEAIPYLTTALKLKPAMLPAHSALGLIYARLGKTSEAIPHLQAALPSDDDGSLHYQLARVYQASGETEKAQRMIAKYQEIRSRSEAEEHKLEKEAVITAPQL